MRANEFTDSNKLVIFDIDDTLVNTNTRVGVVKNGQVIRSLDSHEFTLYKKQPDETFDFGAFRNAQDFFKGAQPIAPMIQQLRNDITTGNKVVMITARADFDDKEVFLNTFKQWKVDMSKVHVYRAGNDTRSISIDEKKAHIITQLLNQGNYTKAIMYDDSVPNLESFLKLRTTHPKTRFYAWHVDHDGVATEFARAVNEDEKTPNPAEAWVKKVYDMYPEWPYGQADRVMVWGEGQDQQFAAFKLKPLAHRDRPTVELSWIMAGPEQRQGVGSRAIKELQRMASLDGIRLTLFPWAHGQVSQPKLMKLYKRHGFRPQNKGSKHMQWEPEMNELAGIKKHVNQIQQNYDTGAGMPDPYDDEVDYEDAMDDPSVQNKSIAYASVLEKHGFVQMGSGAYASVWRHPKLNYVLKVFVEDDRAYIEWAKICLANKDNPNLPKLLSRKPIKISDYFYAVRMEKLTECNQQLRPVIRDISILVDKIDGNLGIKNPNDVKSYIEGQGLDRDKDDYDYSNLLYYITNVDTGIVNAIWLVIQAVRNQLGYGDLAIRNFMMRGDTLVFTDPLA